MKWEEFFPQKELRFPPSFQSRVISCASMEVLQSYLAWRQSDCHLENMYNTCLWMLIKSGNTELEAREIVKAEIGAENNLKEKQKHKQNELLFQKFGINYTELPSIFRQGSSIFKTKAEEIVKYNDNGTPVKRLRKKVVLVYSKNIAARSFWNKHLSLLKELGSFGQDLNKVRSEYLESFQLGSKLTLTNWIVIRIDGCHFHRFAEVHEFEKPNDEQALCLMNSCAVAVLEEFNDIVFSYGMSDEYRY
ncbi:unnamed protein product [Ilex paraguariensis]|uniref:tRNA(His) guanylyltransferase n=1 Tax=Ilex paraguariensis TaxID=185542 RepID=A0ABC8QZX3_9AQUA